MGNIIQLLLFSDNSFTTLLHACVSANCDLGKIKGYDIKYHIRMYIHTMRQKGLTVSVYKYTRACYYSVLKNSFQNDLINLKH